MSSASSLLTFCVGQTVYGIDHALVHDFRGYGDLLRPLGSPPETGFLTIRGTRINVLDLRYILGKGDDSNEGGAFVTIVVVNLEGRQIGLIPNAMDDIVLLEALVPRKTAHPLPSFVSEILAQSDGQNEVSILDVHALNQYLEALLAPLATTGS